MQPVPKFHNSVLNKCVRCTEHIYSCIQIIHVYERMISVQFIIITLFWAIFGNFSILLHEYGHLLAMRLCNNHNGWHITLGPGVPIIKTKRYTLRSWFIIPSGFISSKQTDITTRDIIFINLGGPLVSLLVMVAFIIFRLNLYKQGVFDDIAEMTLTALLEQILSIIVIFNAFTFLFSIIPMRYPYGEASVSDGMRILNAIKNANKK